MQRINIDQDIKPLSELRRGLASFIKQVHETKRPLVITQNGKGVAVLLDSREFEAMQEKIELLSDIQEAANQLAAGEGLDQDEAKAKVLKSIRK